MNIRSTLLATSVGIALLMQPLHAGGPVIAAEEPPGKIAEGRGEGGWELPVIVGLIVICAIACGSDGGPDVQPAPPCNNDGGC